MKTNTGKYREVTKLPSGAMTVPEYAKQEGITPNYIYMLKNRGKDKGRFEIVVFQTVNFVIPNKKYHKSQNK